MAVTTFNPGPSKLAPGVEPDLAAIAASGLLAASHRSAEVKKVVRDAIAAIRAALDVPEDYAVVLQPSATASMELVIRNLVAAGPTGDGATAHIVGGAFGERFAGTSAALRHHPHRIEHPWSEAPRLDAEIPAEVQLISVTHNETSTGMLWPAWALARLRGRILAEHPRALLAVDATSSLGGVEIDFTQGDVWFASVQKALGLPAGLALVIAGPRAVERARDLGVERAVAPWQDLPLMVEKIETGQTFETPSVLGIALLGRRMARFDLTAAAERCGELTAQVQEAHSSGRLAFDWFVEDPAWRSTTVQNLVVDDPAAWVRRAEGAGFLLGGGYGKLKDRCIRIATFPSHEPGELKELLGILAG